MACYIMFMAAHFYASWGLFIPAAIVVGIGASSLWTSKCTYLTTVGLLTGYFAVFVRLHISTDYNLRNKGILFYIHADMQIAPDRKAI